MRRRGDATGPRERGRFERILFAFMGPPQLGDPSAAPTVARDPAQDLCHRCSAPWDGHEIVRTASRTYARCPTPSG